jgi:hypothetical protein
MNKENCHVKALRLNGKIFFSYYNGLETPVGGTPVMPINYDQFKLIEKAMKIKIPFGRDGKNITEKEYRILQKLFN